MPHVMLSVFDMLATHGSSQSATHPHQAASGCISAAHASTPMTGLS